MTREDNQPTKEKTMHYEKNAITCPHCDHEYTTDEMSDHQADLYALAPNEGIIDLQCPVCDLPFFVKGGYRPHYTTAFAEEEL